MFAGAAGTRIEIVKIEASEVIVIVSAIVMVTVVTGTGSTSTSMFTPKVSSNADHEVMIGEEIGIDQGLQQNVGSCKPSRAFVVVEVHVEYASIDTCWIS